MRRLLGTQGIVVLGYSIIAMAILLPFRGNIVAVPIQFGAIDVRMLISVGDDCAHRCASHAAIEEKSSRVRMRYKIVIAAQACPPFG
jgi:hypothetical protein